MQGSTAHLCVARGADGRTRTDCLRFTRAAHNLLCFVGVAGSGGFEPSTSCFRGNHAAGLHQLPSGRRGTSPAGLQRRASAAHVGATRSHRSLKPASAGCGRPCADCSGHSVEPGVDRYQVTHERKRAQRLPGYILPRRGGFGVATGNRTRVSAVAGRRTAVVLQPHSSHRGESNSLPLSYQDSALTRPSSDGAHRGQARTAGRSRTCNGPGLGRLRLPLGYRDASSGCRNRTAPVPGIQSPVAPASSAPRIANGRRASNPLLRFGKPAFPPSSLRPHGFIRRPCRSRTGHLLIESQVSYPLL